MSDYIYTDGNGEATEGLSKDQAMQMYAANGFNGLISRKKFTDCVIGWQDNGNMEKHPGQVVSTGSNGDIRTFYRSDFMSIYGEWFSMSMVPFLKQEGFEHINGLDLTIDDLENWDPNPWEGDLEKMTEVSNDEPVDGETYNLTGSTSSIAAGNTWEESKVKPVLRTVQAGQNSEIAKQRIEKHDEMLAKLGLHRPMRGTSTGEMLTVGGYKLGDVTLASATTKIATGRREWESQPLVEEGLSTIQDAVRSEDRWDHPAVQTKDLWFRDDGKLVTPDMELGMEAEGLKSFMSSVVKDFPSYVDENGNQQYKKDKGFPGAFRFLMTRPLEERVHILNTVLKEACGELKLRTRVNDDNERGIFATVTPKYASFDADKVAERIGNAVAGLGYRGEATYDSATTKMQFDATYHAKSNIVDFAAGDVFKVGLRGKSSDAGVGAVFFGPLAFWNACLNMIIISTKEKLSRLVHKGSMERIDFMFQQEVAKAQPVFEQFARDWGCLAETPMLGVKLWGESYTNVEDVFEAVAKFLGDDAKKAVKVEHLLNAYNTQSEKDTLQAVANAATRMVHEAEKDGQKLLDDINRDKLERASGNLVRVLARQAANA